MARLNKYMNSYDKNKWVQVMFIAEALDHITQRTDLYNENIINYINKAKENIIKAMQLAFAHYPQLGAFVNNSLTDMRVLWIPKRAAEAEFKKVDDETRKRMAEEPAEVLYDFLDVAYSKMCKGCTNCKSDCWLYAMNKTYGMPTMDNNTKDCEYKF